MDHLDLRDKEFEVDLESGGTTSEEDGTRDPVSANRQTNRIFNWVWTGHFGTDSPVNGKCDTNFCSNLTKFGETVNENMQSLLEKNLEGDCKESVAPLGKNSVEGKYKKPNSRKAPKPPRPPKGPSLDAADHELVREIAELAMRKRARIERIKALKKIKTTKGSNSCSSLSAMIVTLIFCLIVIFQGFCFRNSGSVGMHGSPAPAVTASESLISIQFYKSFSARESDGPGAGSVKNPRHCASSQM
ncbi:hypothetical protein AB3S75_021721 [Citrus x aurantiifolia]